MVGLGASLYVYEYHKLCWGFGCLLFHNAQKNLGWSLGASLFVCEYTTNLGCSLSASLLICEYPKLQQTNLFVCQYLNKYELEFGVSLFVCENHSQNMTGVQAFH